MLKYKRDPRVYGKGAASAEPARMMLSTTLVLNLTGRQQWDRKLKLSYRGLYRDCKKDSFPESFLIRDKIFQPPSSPIMTTGGRFRVWVSRESSV